MADRDVLEAAYASALRKLETMPVWSDVTQWADQKLGVQLWSVQRTIAQMVSEKPRTAVWSCHDSGKSFLAAVLTCHHIDTHPVRQARVVTTAPSGHQVKGVLWVEINGLWERARDLGNPLPGRVNQTEWWIGSYQAAIGRKPNEYNAEQFAGFHARYPLVIMDEADGIPHELWEAIEALLTNRRARLFCIGNPLNPGSDFAAIRKGWEAGDDAWAGCVIPYDTTPNFSGEEVSEYVKDVMLGTEWVETKRRQWGNVTAALDDPSYQPLDNPFWWGRVLAQYPPEDSATIVTMAAVQLSTRHDEPPPEDGFVQLGVDVAASEGGDWTVVRERRGNALLRRWRCRSGDDDVVEAFIVQCALEAGAQRIVLDATGVGFGFTGRLKKKLPRCRVVPVQFAASANVKQEDGKTRKFANLRAQLYWEVGREKLSRGEVNLAHMDEYEQTVADMCAARLDPEALAEKQLIKVEDKDEIKRRLKRSPDDGEAALLSMYEPPGSGLGSIHSPAGRRLATGVSAVTTTARPRRGVYTPERARRRYGS